MDRFEPGAAGQDCRETARKQWVQCGHPDGGKLQECPEMARSGREVG